MVAQDPLPWFLHLSCSKSPLAVGENSQSCFQNKILVHSETRFSCFPLWPPAFYQGRALLLKSLGRSQLLCPLSSVLCPQHCPLSWSHCSHKCSYRKSTLSFPLSLFPYNFSSCFSLRSHSICRPSGKFSHKVEKPWKGVGCRRHKPGARQGVSSEACRPGAWTFHLCKPSLVIGQGSALCSQPNYFAIDLPAHRPGLSSSETSETELQTPSWAFILEPSFSFPDSNSCENVHSFQLKAFFTSAH